MNDVARTTTIPDRMLLAFHPLITLATVSSAPLRLMVGGTNFQARCNITFLDAVKSTGFQTIAALHCSAMAI